MIRLTWTSLFGLTRGPPKVSSLRFFEVFGLVTVHKVLWLQSDPFDLYVSTETLRYPVDFHESH